MSQNHDHFDFNLNWPVDDLRDDAVSRRRPGGLDEPPSEGVDADSALPADEPPGVAELAATPSFPEPPSASIPAAPGDDAGSVEPVAAPDGTATDARRVTEWLEAELASMRGELRSWLNEAFASLRADLDVKASELLERQIAVAGLVKVATELQERQFAVAELVEVARTGRQLAELVGGLPEHLGALATGVEAGSRSSAEAQAAVDEARSVLADIRAAAATTQAKANELASLREELSGHMQTLGDDLSRQVASISGAQEVISAQVEMTSRLNETLARQAERLSVPIEALSRHVDEVARSVPTDEQAKAQEARWAAIDEVVEQARRGHELAEAARDLPAQVAEAVSASVRPEDTHAAIRDSVNELRTALDGVQSSIRELRESVEARQTPPEEVEATRALLEELVENARAGQRLAAVVDAIPGRIDEAVRASLRAANEESGAGGLPMLELGSVLSSVRSSISDLRSRLDEAPAPPDGALEPPVPAEGSQPDAEREVALPGADQRPPTAAEAPGRQAKRFLGRRSSRERNSDPSPAAAGRGRDE